MMQSSGRLLACGLLAAAIMLQGAAALYEKGSPVLSLGPNSFNKVTKSKVPVIVVRPLLAASPPS